MKLPLGWIGLFSNVSDLVAKTPAKDLAHQYSIHTAEIESIEHAGSLDKVVVARVVSAERHPESTKLWICVVDQGSHGQETILTGAQNVRVGGYVPVAMIGARLSAEFEISERKMAGMISRGMICGADEIGLSAVTSGGIMNLEDHWSVDILAAHLGKNLFDLHLPVLAPSGSVVSYSLKDTIFEIDNKNITSRPDLFGLIGHAREFDTLFHTGLQNVGVPTDLFPAKVLNTVVETPKVSTFNLLEIR